jgi:hypothetical protein
LADRLPPHLETLRDDGGKHTRCLHKGQPRRERWAGAPAERLGPGR